MNIHLVGVNVTAGTRDDGVALKYEYSFSRSQHHSRHISCSIFTTSAVLQALVRTLSGVMNKISNIIPNSSDIPSSEVSSCSSKHATASVDDDHWSDEDALDINVTLGSFEVCR